MDGCVNIPQDTYGGQRTHVEVRGQPWVLILMFTLFGTGFLARHCWTDMGAPGHSPVSTSGLQERGGDRHAWLAHVFCRF